LLLAPSAGFAKPKPKPLPQEQVPLWDEDAGDGVCGAVGWFRQQFPEVRGTRNVASIRFKYPNGKTGTIVIPSEKFPKGGEIPDEPKGHSERRLIRIVEQLGIDPDTVESLCTELEPCELPGAHCKRQVATNFKNARVYYTHPYPYGGKDKAAEKAVRDTSVKTLRKEVAGYHKQLQATKGIMGEQGGGALQRGLARGFGGIDFSSLELRYVADTGGPRGLRYAFAGNPTAGTSDQEAGLATARQSSNAFFTWLALPPETFWVNLNPNQPDRIMDPQLARTEAGRILLEADLVLKKDSVNWMNVDTAFGKAFWDQLEAIYGDRALDSCITMRTWIAPAQACGVSTSPASRPSGSASARASARPH
jgi:Xanthomonas XOO_2897-like deaminase